MLKRIFLCREGEQEVSQKDTTMAADKSGLMISISLTLRLGPSPDQDLTTTTLTIMSEKDSLKGDTTPMMTLETMDLMTSALSRQAEDAVVLQGMTLKILVTLGLLIVEEVVEVGEAQALQAGVHLMRATMITLVQVLSEGAQEDVESFTAHLEATLMAQEEEVAQVVLLLGVHLLRILEEEGEGAFKVTQILEVVIGDDLFSDMEAGRMGDNHPSTMTTKKRMEEIQMDLMEELHMRDPFRSTTTSTRIKKGDPPEDPFLDHLLEIMKMVTIKKILSIRLRFFSMDPEAMVEGLSTSLSPDSLLWEEMKETMKKAVLITGMRRDPMEIMASATIIEIMTSTVWIPDITLGDPKTFSVELLKCTDKTLPEIIRNRNIMVEGANPTSPGQDNQTTIVMTPEVLLVEQAMTLLDQPVADPLEAIGDHLGIDFLPVDHWLVIGHRDI